MTSSLIYPNIYHGTFVIFVLCAMNRATSRITRTEFTRVYHTAYLMAHLAVIHGMVWTGYHYLYHRFLRQWESLVWYTSKLNNEKCSHVRCDLLCTGYVFFRALIGGKEHSRPCALFQLKLDKPTSGASPSYYIHVKHWYVITHPPPGLQRWFN